MLGNACALIGVFVLGLFVLFVMGRMPAQYARERKRARSRAEQQFRSYRANGVNGPLLSGADAEILDQYDSYTSHNGHVHDYVLTLFVLTPEGRHFLFKSNESGMPYVASLSEERARLVLKGKYRGRTQQGA